MAAGLIDVDALVLTGGRASRLGGASKADVDVDGTPLLVHVLGIASGARATMVVGPVSEHHPQEFTTVEDPPGGGPVAGIAAGLAALDRMVTTDTPPAQWVLVLACDAPFAAPAVAALEAAASTTAADATVEAFVAHDGTWRQPLLALYRRAALAGAISRMDVAGASMRSLLEQLEVVDVEAPAGSTRDLDTWEDVHAAQGGGHG